MNSDNCCRNTRAGIYTLAVAGTFLLVAGLVALMRHYTAAPPIFATRSSERLKMLQDMRSANEPLVDKYDWQDQARGVIRIPLARAKELALQEGQDAAAARTKLTERATLAYKPLPKPPEKKNVYE